VIRKTKPNQSSPCLPKPGQEIVPRNCSSAVDLRFFADLAAHAGDDVLVRFELAAEAVVLAEVGVVGARVAVHEQHAARSGDST
jgi:hypothetical protein